LGPIPPAIWASVTSQSSNWPSSKRCRCEMSVPSQRLSLSKAVARSSADAGWPLAGVVSRGTSDAGVAGCST
jgi:hypothetical protein